MNNEQLCNLDEASLDEVVGGTGNVEGCGGAEAKAGLDLGLCLGLKLNLGLGLGINLLGIQL